MKRHPLDPVAFIGGALFTILGVFALYGGDVSRLNAGWVWPATLAVVGLMLMVLTARSTVISQRRNGDETPAPPSASSASSISPDSPASWASPTPPTAPPGD